MATTAIETEPSLSPAIRALLRSLRGRIRLYVWLEGLATAATWLGAAFWASLVIDWFFEPPRMVRAVMLAVVAGVLVVVLVRLVVRRAFVRLSGSNMAMLLERRFPHLDDSLLTAVVLSSREADAAECNRQMLARTCRQAAERIGGVEIRSVFNPLPLRRAAMAALLLATSVAAFAGLSGSKAMFSGALGTWARRCLLFSTEPWPRRARLIVEGFEGNVAKVARGADLQVVAKADTSYAVVPEKVEVLYRVEGGRRDRKAMVLSGKTEPEYSHKFQGILAPIRFDLVGRVRMGRDVRVANLRIEVVDSPTVTSMTLQCIYPAYTGLDSREVSATGMMQIPQGTNVVVLARTNKELRGVRVESVVGEQSPMRTQLEPSILADDRRSFRCPVPPVDEETTLLFTLSDTDGITGREPVTLVLTPIADGPPQLTVQLEGIGAAITPQARLPAVGRVADDYGIAEVVFEYSVDQQQAAVLPLDIPAGHPASLPLDDTALDVRGLGLSPGQKLLVGLKATDLCELADEPNVGTSERWLLDIVTEEQLRALLEARELVLRQRFEAIVEEVAEMRDLLLRVDFGTTGGGAAAEPGPDEGAEPGDQPEVLSPERQLDLRTWRVRRALTNSGKNAQETLGVAEGFDHIRLQLINNRVGAEESIRRIGEGIADPLFQIAEEMFPLLQSRLERLHESLEDEELGPQRRDLAREQADAILTEMRRVLDRMIELEDFNEAVELLRMIIQLQEELEEDTRERHKRSIRELLEGDG